MSWSFKQVQSWIKEGKVQRFKKEIEAGLTLDLLNHDGSKDLKSVLIQADAEKWLNPLKEVISKEEWLKPCRHLNENISMLRLCLLLKERSWVDWCFELEPSWTFFAQQDQGRNPLEFLLLIPFDEHCCEEMIQRGADFNARDSADRNLLEYAIQTLNVKAVSYLLKKEKELNLFNTMSNGLTALEVLEQCSLLFFMEEKEQIKALIEDYQFNKMIERSNPSVSPVPSPSRAVRKL